MISRKRILEAFLPDNLFRDKWSIFFLLLTLVFLVIEYFGWQGPFHRLMGGSAFYTSLGRMDRNLYAQLWTTVSFLIFLVLIPTLVLRLAFQKEDYQWMLGLGSLASSYKAYILAYVLMFLPLVLAAKSPAFYRFYPLYRPESYSQWVLFELIYLPQFFAVEFFFRGPLLSYANKRLGVSALFLMVFPYALIHIHKPFTEALGSIVAGIVLGHMALKGRSIWGGVALHMLVALTMDTAALYFSGTLASFH